MSAPSLSLEALFTSAEGFGLTTASPLQRAICRAADGLQVSAGDDLGLSPKAMRDHFGVEHVRATRARIIEIIAGVRSGKSLMLACAMVKAALTVDLGKLRPHEVARGAIVASSVDNANATFRLLVGSVRGSPLLASTIINETADTLTMRRPDGRIVEIVVVAAHRGGMTLRSRWLFAFAIEEAALIGVEGGSITAEEILRAGEMRMLPNAQIWIVSSPFGPEGLLYTLWREHFGRPDRVLVIHAPSTAMNPNLDLADIAASRARDPDGVAREIDALWISSSIALLDGITIDAAARDEPLVLPPLAGVRHVAAMDPAMKGNSWTIVIARADGPKVTIVLADQWTGSRSVPLIPSVVLRDIARLVKPYNVREINTDGYQVESLRDIAATEGLKLIEQSSSTDNAVSRWMFVKNLFADRLIDIPRNPTLIADLKSVRRRALANGIRIDLPTTQDGRHADYAPSVALAVTLARRPAAAPPTFAGIPRLLGIGTSFDGGYKNAADSAYAQRWQGFTARPVDRFNK